MAFIKIIPPGKASGETAEVYKQLVRVTGQSMVPKIVQIFSLRPGSMRRMIRLWELSMWVGQAPRQNREMVAAAVSRSNRCYY